MLSICTSSYRETDSLEIFIRTVFGNASDPSNVEIVIANDGNYLPTKELLTRLSLEFPNLKFFCRTKRKRIKWLSKIVDFYEKENIFTPEVIADMRERIAKYKIGELSSIWFPAGELFNKASQIATGDVLLFVPSDYICFADLSRVYDAFKQTPGDIVGHFEWLDTTSLDPMPDIIGIVRGMKTHQEFKETTDKWLEQAFSNGVAHVWQQHGMRMMTREVFEKARMFDGRWFTRSWNEDSLNERVDQVASRFRLLDLNQFQNLNPYFGTIRGVTWREPEYLSSIYRSIPEVHNEFISKIKFYLEREVRQ